MKILLLSVLAAAVIVLAVASGYQQGLVRGERLGEETNRVQIAHAVAEVQRERAAVEAKPAPIVGSISPAKFDAASGKFLFNIGYQF